MLKYSVVGGNEPSANKIVFIQQKAVYEADYHDVKYKFCLARGSARFHPETPTVNDLAVNIDRACTYLNADNTSILTRGKHSSTLNLHTNESLEQATRRFKLNNLITNTGKNQELTFEGTSVKFLGLHVDYRAKDMSVK